MSQKQVWIVVGVAAATLAFGYLSHHRENKPDVTEVEGILSYLSTGGGGGTVPTGSVQPIP